MNVPRSLLLILSSLNIKRDTLISIRNFIRYIQHQFLFFLSAATAAMGSKESSPPPTQSIEPPPPPPPPFDPLKPSIPISFPLKTLEELESRSYFKSFHYPFNKTSESAPPITSALPSRPRMLVCHDMAGGYTDDDKWVQGGTNEGAYAIWHWYLIDVFVYFSHNLVTIPPPCWTNAAHTHGVKVLGTFITEWDEGRVICNTLLSTKESAELYAERLTELAVALGFDGWLINMEVELDVGQIPNLKVLVNHLTNTMHSAMPGSLVMWYDSVTIDGNLDWQNQLNDSNKPFFDLCDGIFINYTWAEDYPKNSATVAGDRKFDVYMGIDVFGRNTYGGGQWTPYVARTAATTRVSFSSVTPAFFTHRGVLTAGTIEETEPATPSVPLDTDTVPDSDIAIVEAEVLVCVVDAEKGLNPAREQAFQRREEWHADVITWADPMDTNVALDVIKRNDVSAAVFAPGWVYETNQPPDFQTAQNRWWGLVEKSWGIHQYYPKSLPFYSNFDQGHGYHFSVDGGQISNDPWCNISCQNFQPVLSNSVGSSPDTIQFMVDFKNASFSGGGNINFQGTLEDNAYFSTILFRGELPLDDVPIHITHSVKSDGSSLLGLYLEFSYKLKERTSILVAYDSMDQFKSKFDKVVTPHRVTNLERGGQAAPGWIIQESSISMNGYTLTEIHVVCYKSKTQLNKSKLEQAPKLGGTELAQAGTWPSSAFLALLCCCCSPAIRTGPAPTLGGGSEFSASLGHITIKTFDNTPEFPPSNLWVVEGQNISWAAGPSGVRTVSVKITWSLKEGASSQFPVYNIYAEKQAKKVIGDKDDEATATAEEYIGVTRVRAFYVSEYVVPASIFSVKFIIQVCGIDGACQKLDSSPVLILDVEGPVSNIPWVEVEIE